MRIVLDANEYVLGLGTRPDPTCRRVLRAAEERPGCELRIPRTIADEVHANLTPGQAALFFRIISRLGTIDEDWTVPHELREKYARLGFKPADALIAGYAEHVAADYLVSENRHFLTRRADLPFQVVTAEEFVRTLGDSSDH